MFGFIVKESENGYIKDFWNIESVENFNSVENFIYGFWEYGFVSVLDVRIFIVDIFWNGFKCLWKW